MPINEITRTCLMVIEAVAAKTGFREEPLKKGEHIDALLLLFFTAPPMNPVIKWLKSY